MTTDVVMPVYATNDRLVEMAQVAIAQLEASADVHIIVVDNGWHEDRGVMFAAQQYVRLPENQGYAGGVNVGLSMTTSDVVVVSSIDVIVWEGWDLIIDKAREHDGIASPSAMRFMYGFTTNEWEQPECDYWGGIFAMTRRVFETLGGMDTEHFRLRHADTDFGIRAAKAGFWVGRVREVIVEHRDPSISTLMMGVDAVDAELQELQRVHGKFPMGAWKAESFR